MWLTIILETITIMTKKLKDLAKSLILEKSSLDIASSLDFEETDPLFIPIKNNHVSLSKKIESLEDADACMVFYTFFRNDTVPDKLVKGKMETIRIPQRGFGYIDPKQGEMSLLYFDNGFSICALYDNTLQLQFYGVELMSIIISKKSITDLWDCYQIAKKCISIKQKNFEKGRKVMQKKINTMRRQLDELTMKLGTIWVGSK